MVNHAYFKLEVTESREVFQPRKFAVHQKTFSSLAMTKCDVIGKPALEHSRKQFGAAVTSGRVDEPRT